MPNMPVLVTPIETYMPSIDVRNAGKAHVIDGKNFMFDSKGPKSGFGSDILSPFEIYAPRDIQGLSSQGRTFVMTQDAILEWRKTVPFNWDLIYTFDSSVPETARLPWNVAYLDGSNYFVQMSRGLFKATEDDVTQKLVFTAVTDVVIPGLIQDIQAIAVVRNRMILVNRDQIQWSNTGELDLTPGLGGAGFQYIQTFTRGTFVALTEFEDGFIVWTTEGSVIAEFIDGDAVWRFYPGTSLERPMGAWCTVRLASGVHVFLSRHGLFVTQGGDDPQPWTPEFNEFLGDYLTNLSGERILWRIEYDSERQIMYVMESNDGTTYWRSFVLTPTRNKWGIFNEPVYGLGPLSPDEYGFVGTDKLPRFFIDGYYRLDTPENAEGLDRHYPLSEKGLQTPSSSSVSRALVFDATSTMETFTIPAVGWYGQAANVASGNQVGSLDSWIEIGYVQAPQMQETVDAFPEIQEVSYGSIPEFPPEIADFTTLWNYDHLYPVDEDWDSATVLMEEDVVEDLLVEEGFKDLLYGLNETIDFLNYVVYREVPDSTTQEEDWNLLVGDEDWDAPALHTNPVTSRIYIHSSQDGRTFQEYEPVLARFDTEAKLLTTMAGGTFHRIRIEATRPFEYYHVTYLAVTFEYGGQLI